MPRKHGRRRRECSAFSPRRPRWSTPLPLCPAAASRLPTAATHYVNGHPLKGPYPEDSETAIFGLGCFWGAERKFWQAGEGVYVTAVGYAGGFTPNPTYEEACSGLTGHTEAVLVVYRPKLDLLRAIAQTVLGEPRPDAGHAAGQRRRHAIPLGDLRHHRRAARGRARLGAALRRVAEGEGLRSRNDGDRQGRPVLLRRGLPPAISRQEPRRLLRPRRHRRLLPDRRRGRRETV